MKNINLIYPQPPILKALIQVLLSRVLLSIVLLTSILYVSTSQAQTKAEGKKLVPAINLLLSKEAAEPNKVFWANFGAGISSVNLSTQVTETINTLSGTTAIGINPQNRKLYFEYGTSNKTIAELDLNTGAQQDLISNVGSSLGDIAVHPTTGQIYWSNFNTNEIWRSDADGSNATKIVNTSTSPSGLTIDADNGVIYFVTYNNTGLFKVNLDGSGLLTLNGSLGGQGVAIQVNPDTQKLYYTIRSSVIYQSDIDGSNAIELISGQSAVQGMAIDIENNKIYWANAGTSNIRSANLNDGSNVQDESDTGNSPWQIGFMPGS